MKIGWLLHPNLRPLLAHGTPVFLAVIAAIVFAESGLLIGFFLPGDSLLFSAVRIALPERLLHRDPFRAGQRQGRVSVAVGFSGCSAARRERRNSKAIGSNDRATTIKITGVR